MLIIKQSGEYGMTLKSSKKTKPIHKIGMFRLSPIARWVKFAAITSVTSTFAFSATAQEAQTENLEKAAEDIEVVQIIGTRRTIQDQIAIKREATTVVDGLSASDIGDLPALSIGEALETLTGASSHRENGGATEISIRGLGPFLSATHINGREATNGSGDRSVNFSQFPSELMQKVAIYKTQDASMIEGGVAGVISLETLKPLDFGKQRFQAEVKGNYNPDQANVDNSLQGDLGYRGTLSYVDQFEFNNGQALGVSVGFQRQDISQPEAEYRSSSPTGSSLWACLNDPTNAVQGFFKSHESDCENIDSTSANAGYNTEIDPDTGLAVDDGTPYAWTGSSRSFRQNETSDERDALFFALQYQPSDKWDINLDAQISDRTQAESRHDLIFLQKRVTSGVTGENLITNDVGGILHWEGSDRIESAGEQFSREENYRGYGLNIEHYYSDDLKINVDFGYSKTSREELQISNRGRTSSTGNAFSWDLGEYIPHFTLTDFDVTDISNFTSDLRTRLDRENVRDNEVVGARVDIHYNLDSDVFSSVQAGVRVSELSFVQFGGSNGNGSRDTYTTEDEELGLNILEECQIDFPESDFLSSVSDGDIITNIDSTGNVIESGTGASWATYNNECFSQAVVASQGGEFAYPELEYENQGTIDVTEKTTSAYVMLNYDTEMMGKFIRGNFGVRVVNTDVTSIGFRQGYVFSQSPLTDLWSSAPAGEIQRTVAGSDYTEVLPSFNLVVDYSEDILLRAGIYRGMSRVDPSDLGFNRTIDIDDTGEATSREDLLTGVTGSGNPSTQPLMSWNYDAAVEWYPSDDSMVALGADESPQNED